MIVGRSDVLYSVQDVGTNYAVGVRVEGMWTGGYLKEQLFLVAYS